MSDLVGNPEDLVSRDAAFEYIILIPLWSVYMSMRCGLCLWDCFYVLLKKIVSNEIPSKYAMTTKRAEPNLV